MCFFLRFKYNKTISKLYFLSKDVVHYLDNLVSMNIFNRQFLQFGFRFSVFYVQFDFNSFMKLKVWLKKCCRERLCKLSLSATTLHLTENTESHKLYSDVRKYRILKLHYSLRQDILLFLFYYLKIMNIQYQQKKT